MINLKKKIQYNNHLQHEKQSTAQDGDNFREEGCGRKELDYSFRVFHLIHSSWVLLKKKNPVVPLYTTKLYIINVGIVLVYIRFNINASSNLYLLIFYLKQSDLGLGSLWLILWIECSFYLTIWNLNKRKQLLNSKKEIYRDIIHNHIIIKFNKNHVVKKKNYRNNYKHEVMLTGIPRVLTGSWITLCVLQTFVYLLIILI